jgi:branched-chain amino acid aminotransferase
MSQRVWCNGEFIEGEILPVSAFDRGLTVGLGLFETILAVDGQPVFLPRHLARHQAGCERLGWDMPSRDDLSVAIGRLLQSNGLAKGRARVRFFQTGGQGLLDAPSKGQEALAILTATELPPSPESASVTFSKWPRNERSALVGLKCASYAENLIALSDARRQGFEETYFLNTQGDVCEAALANLFVVKNDRIATPPLESGCLPGVTRGWVLETFPEAEERRVTRNDLLEADEVFLTSATRGPMKVSRLDGRVYEREGISARTREAWEAAIA